MRTQLNICSKYSRSQRKNGVIGTAGSRNKMLLLEYPKPWGRIPLQTKSLPPEIKNGLITLQKKYPGLTIHFIASENSPSSPGHHHVMVIEKKQTPKISFKVGHYQVPRHSLETFLQGGLLGETSHIIGESFRFSQKTGPMFFICTHEARDFCCGRFGGELYEKVKEVSSKGDHSPHVWQCSHIGGHRLAPTFFSLETMGCWGDVTSEDFFEIAKKEPSSRVIRDKYRGWYGLKDGYEQKAEQHLYLTYGSRWLTFEILEVCKEATSLGDLTKDVTIFFRKPASKTIEQKRLTVTKKLGALQFASCTSESLEPTFDYEILPSPELIEPIKRADLREDI